MKTGANLAGRCFGRNPPFRLKSVNMFRKVSKSILKKSKIIHYFGKHQKSWSTWFYEKKMGY